MAPGVGHSPCCAAGTVGGCGCPAKVCVAPCVGALCPCCPVRVVGWLRLNPVEDSQSLLVLLAACGQWVAAAAPRRIAEESLIEDYMIS